MTIVAAIKDGDAIVVCSDTAATDEAQYSLRKHSPKVWTAEVPFLGSVILGFAGTFSLCQFMRYSFDAPEFEFDHTTIHSYLASSFQPELRRAMVKFRKTYDSKELDEWTLLFCAKSQIFTLYPNGDVEENAEDFSAIGDGAEVAIGALGALKDIPYTSWEKLQTMYEVVKKSRNSVRGPLQFETIGM